MTWKERIKKVLGTSYTVVEEGWEAGPWNTCAVGEAFVRPAAKEFLPEASELRRMALGRGDGNFNLGHLAGELGVDKTSPTWRQMVRLGQEFPIVMGAREYETALQIVNEVKGLAAILLEEVRLKRAARAEAEKPREEKLFLDLPVKEEAAPVEEKEKVLV